MIEETGVGPDPPWDEEWFDDADGSEPPRWRAWVIRAVALLAAVALVAVPLGNYLVSDDRPIADNGLEICRYDYCVVEEYMADRGLELDMIRLESTILGDSATVDLVERLSGFLGVAPADVSVVDDLEGRIGGVYVSERRLILIERPSNAWVVAHEVAHIVERGHGEGFRRVLADLAKAMTET